MSNQTPTAQSGPSATTGVSKMKAFQVDDYTWYAAETAEQAIEVYKADTGEDVDTDDGYPSEVSDARLDADIPEYDENEMRTGRWTNMRTFLEEATGPGFLASSEF
jgi:hypothetical protein